MNTIVELDFNNLDKWDVKNAIKSFSSYVKAVGEVLIVLLGLCIMIVGLWHVFKKFTSTQPGGGGESWGKIVAMVIVGGAMAATGSWSLYNDIATGGKQTIQDAGNGNGSAMLDYIVSYL